MAQDAPRRRRARPVSDAPIEGLLADPQPLAKGWMLALLEDAPLSAAPGIPGPSFSVEAPRLCAAALRALADDGELARLGATSESVCAMTGTAGPAGALSAVDALSGVLWAALRGELRAPAPELVGELAERLALVGAVIRDAAVQGAAGASPSDTRSGRTDEAASGTLPERTHETRLDALRGRTDEATSDARSGRTDEATSDARSERTDEAASGSVPNAGPPTPSLPATGTGVPLWMSALADEVHDARVTGRSLSLLLAELEDADRVMASAPAERAAMAFGDFVTALRGALREQDVLVCEADTRAWVIARDTARAAAHSLAARIAEAVGETTSPLSGAPLVASIGIAVLGEDGSDCEELAEAAEEARVSASARGIEVSRRVPEL